MSEQEFSEPTLDTEGLQAYIAELTAEQNMVTAIIAGTATAVVCAGIWGAVTVATGYQIGFMALGVGFLVGHSVRVSGKGMTKKFQVFGVVRLPGGEFDRIRNTHRKSGKRSGRQLAFQYLFFTRDGL